MRPRAIVAAAAVAIVATGCAHRSASHPPFVIGAPGGSAAVRPRATAGDDFETTLAKIRNLQANARPAATPAAPALEQEDSDLKVALAVLSVAPSASAHRQVGAAYRTLGVDDLAHRHFTAAVRLDPQDASSYDALARIWRDWGQPGLALGDAHRAVYFAPRSASAMNTLGTVLQALGHTQKAHDAFVRATRLDSGAAFAFNNLCYLAAQAGRADAAREYCRLAVAGDPGLAVARVNAEWVERLGGEDQ